MITLIFGQLNCGKHNVADWLKSQLDEEVVTLSALLAARERYFADLFGSDPVTKTSSEYGAYDLEECEVFLTAFCRKFTDRDVLIIVPSFCKEAALRCCSEMSHVRCLLVAPSATSIARHRRENVTIDEYKADYFIPAKHYFNEDSIHRSTSLLVKETIAIAKTYDVADRFWCYVAPEYLF